MITFLPGTTIKANIHTKDDAKIILDNIFATGGLVLSQISYLSGMELYTVQNWIKRGFCAPPVAKKYSIRQFCRLIIINMLKDSLTIPEITNLLSYINGHLDDESDDMVEDHVMYLYFVDVITRMSGDFDPASAAKAVDDALQQFESPFAAGKQRLHDVLLIMTYAYFAAKLHKEASALMRALPDANFTDME